MSAALLVADSGPLIALARLQRLDLPSKLFGTVWVTFTVWDEVTRQPRPAEGLALSAARRLGDILVVPDPLTTQDRVADTRFDVLAGARLDPGERSAIALAMTEQAAVLIDERRGRACALALHLPTLGTLGLLVRARNAGLIDRLRPMTDALQASGYFLGRLLVDRALAATGE